MEVTKELKDEHRAIERVLAVLMASTEHLRKGRIVDRKIPDGGADFFTGFVEKCHHKKEERVLFPAVKDRLTDPILTVDHLFYEHKQCVGLVKELAKATGTLYGKGSKRSRANAIIKVVETIRALSELMRHHIAMEDGEFFPMCEELLSEEEKEKVSQKFAQVEQEQEGGHEKYISLVGELEKLAA